MKYHQKPCIKAKKVIGRGKRSKKLNELKPFKSINMNLKSFLEIRPVQKEVPPSHRLQDHPFGLKEDKTLEIIFQNHLSHISLSHIEQQCQESLIQGKIYIQRKVSCEFITLRS